MNRKKYLNEAPISVQLPYICLENVKSGSGNINSIPVVSHFCKNIETYKGDHQVVFILFVPH